MYAQEPQELNLLGTWQGENLVASDAHNNTYNEIWGISVNGYEYAIIGTTAGTHFIDVTDPVNPTESFFLPGNSNGSHIIHRDYHDYAGYLYAVADEGNSTLQIIDITQLPDTVSVVYESGELYKRAHNIFIDSTHAILYAPLARNGSLGYTAMSVFDISNPIDPVFIGSYDNFDGYNISQVHDIYVEDGLAFLNCGPDGLIIADFTDPAAPITLDILEDYPAKGYNHSGWLSEDGQHYYMADEDHGHAMKVIDVSDREAMEVMGTFSPIPEDDLSIPHNPLVKGDFLYVSYYYDGLQVFDISDPVNPQRAAYYDTSTENNVGFRYEGAWGVYPFLPSGNILVSDMQNGLFVFDEVGTVLSNTEIKKANNNSIEVFPQPVSDYLTVNITMQKNQKDVFLSLWDITGRKVQDLRTLSFAKGNSTHTLSLPNLNKGVYWLRFENDDLNLTKKIIINK